MEKLNRKNQFEIKYRRYCVASFEKAKKKKENKHRKYKMHIWCTTKKKSKECKNEIVIYTRETEKNYVKT